MDDRDHPASSAGASGSAPDHATGQTDAAAPAAPPSRVVPRHRARRKRLWTIGALAAVLVVIAAVVLWRYFGTYESTDDAQVDAHLYPVSARVSGYVIKVSVGDNDFVEAGADLVQIDPKDFEVAVEKARADLASAEAAARSVGVTVPVTTASTESQLASAASDIQNATAGIAAAEEQLAAANAQVSEAEANNVKAQNDVRRYALLVERQNVSQQTYDQALAAAKAADAGVAAARANANSAREAVAQAKSRLTQAEASHKAALTGPQQVEATRARALSAAADVKQKRALLDQAELNLRYTRIVAPATGLVRKTVVVGMNIQPGQQLLTIVPLDEVWFTANFKETQLRWMQPGQHAEVTVDATGRTYRAHVDSIGGATGPVFSLLPPENATGNYVKVVQRIPVKIVPEPGQNDDRQLRPGMNVVPKVFLR